ncbi:MAG: chorismate mutase [Caldilineaceae bacterium]|nr:chorismate mutase [Caldilineaceae bacterium]
MKTPDECRTIEEVRSEIDRIDRSMIEIIAQRRAYVHAVMQFKSSAQDVHAHERQRQMLAVRRQWAAEHALSPEMVEGIFRSLVDHFVAEELTILAGRNGT